MKFIKLFLLAFAIALVTPTINAQSAEPIIAFNISPQGTACGRATPTTKCNLPILIDGQPFTLYYDYEANYNTGWVSIYGSEEFESSAVIVNASTYGGTFAGITAGGKHYVITLNLVPSLYRGGYGRTAGTYWLATSKSTISIQYQN